MNAKSYSTAQDQPADPVPPDTYVVCPRLSVPKPDGVASGNLLIGIGLSLNTNTLPYFWAGSSLWSVVQSTPAMGGFAGAVSYRIATASEPANYEVSSAYNYANSARVAMILCYETGLASPVLRWAARTPADPASTTHPSKEFTAGAASAGKDAVVALFGADSVWTPPAAGIPVGQVNSPGRASFLVYEDLCAADGSLPSRNSLTPDSIASCAITVAISILRVGGIALLALAPTAMLRAEVSGGKIVARRAELPGFPWAGPWNVTTGSSDGEPALFGGGTPHGLHCLFTCASGTAGVYETVSYDRGETWSTPAMEFSGGKHPQTAVARDGTVLRAAYVSGKLHGTLQRPGAIVTETEFTLKDSAGADLSVADDSFGLHHERLGLGRWWLCVRINGEASVSDWFSADGQTWTRQAT